MSVSLSVSFSVSLCFVPVMSDCFGASLWVCVCEREGEGHRDAEKWGEREREWGETASAADFQLLHFSPSLSGFSFPPSSFFPLTWSPHLPCERIEPHWGFHIFLIPVLRSWALGRQDVPLLVVRPNGGEWEGISGPDRHPVQWAYLVDAPKISPPF